MKQPDHCKGCLSWHNAGHSSQNHNYQKYNSWCCKYGKPASKAVGRCQLEEVKKHD